MEQVREDYLINNLEQGRNLNILLLSHNAYWPSMQKLENHFQNCNIQIYGDSTSYIRLASKERNKQIENCDLIIFYSSVSYDEDEIMELKDIASRVSEEKGKRVSIGYSYVIPKEQKPYPRVDSQVKIISFNNSQEIETTGYAPEYFTPYDLTELVLAAHDDYDTKEKVKLK